MLQLCAGCGRQPGAPLCDDCRQLIAELRLPAGQGALYAYRGPLRRALLAWKFEAREDVGRELGRLLLAEAPDSELLVAVPPALWRTIWRGIHVPAEMARMLAKARGLPRARLGLVRLSQHAQGARKRRERRETRRLFLATPWARAYAGRRVLLLDDIVTTGTTLDAARARLLEAGAIRCDTLALARAER